MLVISAEIAWKLQPLQSKEEARYYLCGFHVEHVAPFMHIVATDGHALGAFCERDGIFHDNGIGNIYNIPAPVLKECKPGKRDIGRRWLIINGQECGVVMADNAADTLNVWQSKNPLLVLAMAPYQPIKSTYPDWRRVFPNEDNPASWANFDPKVLKQFDRACERDIKIMASGGNPALVLTNDADFVGVVMPKRGTDMDSAPFWLNAKPETVAA